MCVPVRVRVRYYNESLHSKKQYDSIQIRDFIDIWNFEVEIYFRDQRAHS